MIGNKTRRGNRYNGHLRPRGAVSPTTGYGHEELIILRRIIKAGTAGTALRVFDMAVGLDIVEQDVPRIVGILNDKGYCDRAGDRLYATEAGKKFYKGLAGNV